MELPHNHVAVCAFPFGTHATPLLRLVQRLASASPTTRFSFLNAAHSNAALFATANDDVHGNIVACNVTVDDDDGGDAAKDVVINPFERFVLCAPKCFGRHIEEVEVDVGLKITCVISDAFFWFCGEIARDKGLLWIPVWTANVVSLSAHFYTDLLRSKFGVLEPGSEGGEDELEDSVPGFSNIRIKDLPLGIVSGTDSPFSQMLHKMGLMLPKAHAVVVNSFEKLSPTITNDLKSKMNLHCVGPFPLLSSPRVQDFDKYSCFPWLDKQKEKSVVYICFGTVAAPPPDEIVAIAEAVKGSGVPFLWSIDDSKKDHLPSWFINRVREDEGLGKIVSWAPQMKLLGHPSIGGFVTHCGWNSILESIINGVPLICKPMLGDQIINRRFIENVLKVGVGVEGKSGMINALQQVFSSNESKEMRKNMEVLRALAEESTKLGGSSIENLNALIELITSPHQE